MSVRLTRFALLAALAGCSPAGGAPDNMSGVAAGNDAAVPDRPAAMRATEDFARDCPTLNDEPAFAIGRSEAALTAAYGKPAYSSDYVLGRSLNPSNQIVVNVLPLPANADRMVREMGWTRAGCSLTTWLVEEAGEWRSVQALRTPSDAEF